MSDSETRPSRSDALRDGFEIPGYRLVRELGRGGQGTVYEAVQISTKRRVVVKLLHRSFGDSDTPLRRFEREVDIIAQLKHPHIVTVFDSGLLGDGQPYYVMEYIRGVSLGRYVRQKELPLRQVLDLFEKVCAAVQYAHLRGIVHRDLKPSNVLVDTDGQPKVLDFGLAKVLAENSDEVVTMTADLLGTLPYMAPEQTRPGLETVDTRADVYALGVMLYELLTGQFPYPVAGELVDVLNHIARTHPRPLRQSWSSDRGVRMGVRDNRKVSRCPIDDEVSTIVLRCLAKEPERRYQSAGELGRDLQNYMVGDPIVACRDSTWYVLKKVAQRHRTRLIAVSAVSIVLALSAVVTITALRERQLQQEEAALALAKEEVGALLGWLAAGSSDQDEESDGRYREILERVCARIRAGAASPLDCEAFARAYVSARIDGRPLVRAGRDTGISYSFGAIVRWADLAGDLGLCCTSRLHLDGEEIRTPQWADGCLHWIPEWDQDFRVSGPVEDSIPPGPHLLTGALEATIVRIPEKQHFSSWPTAHDDLSAEYEPLPEASVVLTIPELRFTAVDSLPDTYPPKIVDESEASRLRQGFRVDHAMLQPGQLLSMRLSLPVPAITLACDLTLTDAHERWCERMTFRSRHGKVFFSHRSGSEDAPQVEIDTAPGGDGVRRHVMTINLPTIGAQGRRIDPGDTVHVSLTASAAVARSAPDVSEYLHVTMTATAGVTEATADDETD